MRSLTLANEACEKHFPGLLERLADRPWADREKPGGGTIPDFTESGGPGLLVPQRHGGSGADALTAARVTRAIGAVAPSLAAATTMHHFTVAMLYHLASTKERLSGAQREVLDRVAPDNLLLASGWAEGRTSQNILIPAVKAHNVDGGVVLNGSKKPCSLARSMDILTASVAVEDENGVPSLAVALVPSDAPGIEVRDFWRNRLLAGAESDEVVLTDVFVPDELVIRTQPDDPTRLDDLQTAGFAWFELLITSTYLGAASGLVARAVEAGRGSPTDLSRALLTMEAAVSLVEGVARGIDNGLDGDDAVASVLTARYAVQDLLIEACAQAAETLGGMAFISDEEIADRCAMVRALAFHPPSRASVEEPLLAHARGNPLVLS